MPHATLAGIAMGGVAALASAALLAVLWRRQLAQVHIITPTQVPIA